MIEVFKGKKQTKTYYGVQDKFFATKSLLENYIREKYVKPNANGNLFDSSFIRELILGSDSYNRKTKNKPPIKGFKFEINPEFNEHQCLYIYFEDDSYIDISWTKCITPSTHSAAVKAAARREIVSQVLEVARNKNDNDICELTGKRLGDAETQVDHEYEFRYLLQDWLDDNNLTIDDIELHHYREETGGYHGGSQFKDRQLAYSWYDYHANHTRLRIVDKQANLKRG